MTRHTFAERLGQAMEEQDVQTSDLVRQTGIPEAYILRLLRGRVAEPPLFAVYRLAGAIHRSEAYLKGQTQAGEGTVATMSLDRKLRESAGEFNHFAQRYNIGWEEQVRVWDFASRSMRGGCTSQVFRVDDWAAAYQLLFHRPCRQQGPMWTCEGCGNTQHQQPLMCPVCAKDGLRTAEG